MRTPLCRLLLAVLCALIAAGAKANAETNASLAAPYALHASQQGVLDVVRRFAIDHGFALRVAADPKNDWQTAPVDGWVRAPTGQAFLEQLARAYHFSWFIADRTLHVSGSRDSATERIALNGTPADTARTALEAVGIYDARFGWGELIGQDAVLVSGPRAYRALVRRFVARQASAAQAQAGPVPMIFPLRFAQAGDTVPSDTSLGVRPGVATVLRQLLAPDTPVAQPVFTLPAQSDVAPPLPTVAPPLARWLGYPVSTPAAVHTARQGGTVAASQPSTARPIGIVADDATNAVLVWGDRTWQARIQQMIDALDRAAPLVSINVLVIESDLPMVTALSAASESVYAASDLAAHAFDERLAQALADRRARLVNRQTIVGRMHAHTTLTIAGEASQAAGSAGAAGPQEANGRSDKGGDRLDLVARIVPSPKAGATALAIDVDLLMAQPTGLPGQAWANTSSVKLDTAVTVESGAPPRLIASYPVATARAEQRAIFISAKAL